MKRTAFITLVLLLLLPLMGLAEDLPFFPAITATSVTAKAEPPQAAEPDTAVSFREHPYRIWPFYYHRKFEPEHERTIYGPLWLTERDREKTLTYPLWPFTGVTRTGEEVEKLDLLWPFTGYKRLENGAEYNLVWPLTGYSKSQSPTREAESLFLVRPLLGYHHETTRAPGGRVTGERVGYMPFYFGSESDEETFRYVFPSIMTGGQPARESNWHSFLPFYLYAEQPDRTFLFALPSYLRRSEPGRELHSFLPFFHLDEDKTGKTRYVFPSYYRRESADGAFMAGLLPFYLGGNGASGESFRYVFPTWYERHGRGHDTTLLFPVWYRNTHGHDAQNLLLNTWWSREGDSSTFAFVPLYARSTTPTETSTQLLNTYWSGGERLERLMFFPLAWYSSPAPDEADFTFFPLLNYAHKGEDSTFAFLWRLYYQRREGDQAMSAFLWWLYRTEERPDYRRVMCWPFVDYERNSGSSDEVFTSILLRFVTYERNRDRSRVKLLGLTMYEG